MSLLNRSRKTSDLVIDGEAIHLRELSLADAAELEAFQGDDAARAVKLITLSVVDDAGNRVYDPTQIDAIKAALPISIKKQIDEEIDLLNNPPKIDPKKK